MPKRRRRAASKRRRRRPFRRLALGLLLLVVVFCAAAGATLWLAESTQLLSTDHIGGEGSESIRPEERRALEELLERRAAPEP